MEGPPRNKANVHPYLAEHGDFKEANKKKRAKATSNHKPALSV